MGISFRGYQRLLRSTNRSIVFYEKSTNLCYHSMLQLRSIPSKMPAKRFYKRTKHPQRNHRCRRWIDRQYAGDRPSIPRAHHLYLPRKYWPFRGKKHGHATRDGKIPSLSRRGRPFGSEYHSRTNIHPRNPARCGYRHLPNPRSPLHGARRTNGAHRILVVGARLYSSAPLPFQHCPPHTPISSAAIAHLKMDFSTRHCEHAKIMIFGFGAQYATCNFALMLKHMFYTENTPRA